MRLLRQEGADRFEFHLERRERTLFVEVLGAYPVIPPEHHRLCRGLAPGAEDPNQALLADSMKTFKADCRRRLDRFLKDAGRFVPDKQGYRMRLEREEIEWLLMVLNDVRVGSWIQLGSPDPDEEDEEDKQDEEGKEDKEERGGKQGVEAGQEWLRFRVLMELAGDFEYRFLAALDGTSGVGWGPRIG